MNTLAAFGVVVGAIACAGAVTCTLVDHAVAAKARRRLWPSDAPSRRRVAVWSPLLPGLLDRGMSERADRDLPLWLDGSARAARAGASLPHALIDGASALVGRPLDDELRPFVDALERNVPIGIAVDQQRALGSVSRDRSLVWRALALASRSGGPAAELLDAVAMTLHERAALAREVRALATQARASAVVLVAAPLVFALVAATADARVLAFFASPAGIVCVLAGIVLDGVGGWWMSRVTAAAS